MAAAISPCQETGFRKNQDSLVPLAFLNAGNITKYNTGRKSYSLV